MSSLVAHSAVAPARTRTLDFERLRLLASIPFILGAMLSLFGFVWDVQWHVDVGPDTFFTAPHLVLYSGIAIAGLTCLAMVLATSVRYRGVTDGTVSVLWGRFRSPVGYLIGGIGAAMFLLYGLLDQWWHTIYGFDVTLVSPPHVGLILSILITMIGCLCTLAAEVRRADVRGTSWWPTGLGFALTAALLISFITASMVDVFYTVSYALGLPTGPTGTLTFLCSVMLLMTAAVLRRPGAATLVALMMTGLRLFLWYAAPWVTSEYATAVGLFLRDNTEGHSVVAGVLPPYVLLAGILVDLVLLVGRRFGWKVPLTVLLAGALVPVGLELIQTYPSLYVAPDFLFPVRTNLFSFDTITAISPVDIVIGALAGLLGWVIGVILRNHERISTASEADPVPTMPVTTITPEVA